MQLSISGPIGKCSNLGSPSRLEALHLGVGGSFVVRRVSNTAFVHSLEIWDDSFDRSKGFVVVKQPLVRRRGESDFENRLHDVMMELKVSYHEPLRKHPNIVRLHSFMWDTQSKLASALAPSLILEYADLGTVSDFQDSDRLIVHADTKLQICLDVAKGLSFVNECGIIHGDVKCEYVLDVEIQVNTVKYYADHARNILLFRENIHDKHTATAIRAKIGDFGK